MGFLKNREHPDCGERLCGVYLLLSIRSGVLDITMGIIKKVIHFNGKTHSFYNMMYTQIFHKRNYLSCFSINQRSVLLYELISKKSEVLSIET